MEAAFITVFNVDDAFHNTLGTGNAAEDAHLLTVRVLLAGAQQSAFSPPLRLLRIVSAMFRLIVLVTWHATSLRLS